MVLHDKMSIITFLQSITIMLPQTSELKLIEILEEDGYCQLYLV
jgi:hypothetical protein